MKKRLEKIFKKIDDISLSIIFSTVNFLVKRKDIVILFLAGIVGGLLFIWLKKWLMLH